MKGIRVCLAVLGLGLAEAKTFSEVTLPEYASDPAQYEAVLSSAVSSKDPASRIAAANSLALGLKDKSHLAYIWVLLKDPDVQVCGYASLAFSSLVNDSNFSSGELAKFDSFFKERFSMLKHAMIDDRPLLDRERWLLCCDASALNSLYFSKPVISPGEYMNWQATELAPLVRVLSVRRTEQSEKVDNIMLDLLRCVTEPHSISETVAAACEQLENLDPQRIKSTLRILYKHTVVGVDQPMDYVLVRVLHDKIEAIKRVVRETVTEQFERQELEFILSEIQRCGIEKRARGKM